MTVDLPQALADLAANYDRLYDDAEAGHISTDDALAALHALGVLDAAGQVWGLNASGEFTVAAYAGADITVADPAAFALTAVETPGDWDTRLVDEQDSGNPHDDRRGPSVSPHAGPITDNGWDDGAYTEDDQDSFGALLTPPSGHTAAEYGTGDEPRARTRSLSDVESGPAGLAARLTSKLPAGLGARMPNASTILANNKPLLAVVGVGAVLLLAVTLHHNPSAPATKAGSAVPTASQPAPVMPTTTLSAAGTTKATALPTADDLARVRSALSSGHRDRVVAALATKTDTATVANMTAYFYGAAKTGIDIGAGPAAANGKGAVQTWTLTDHSTHVTLRTLTVHWVRAAGVWKLTATLTG